jgi:hypothetical protein
MQIIISVMIVGLLWMIYDIINAPEVDENENPVFPVAEDKKRIIDHESRPILKKDKNISEVEKHI